MHELLIVADRLESAGHLESPAPCASALDHVVSVLRDAVLVDVPGMIRIERSRLARARSGAACEIAHRRPPRRDPKA